MTFPFPSPSMSLALLLLSLTWPAVSAPDPKLSPDPSAPQSKSNWPRFRGPSGQGVSGETAVPWHWTATSNVAWKVSVPGEGWSSPIVWDNHLFLTTTTDDGVSCRVLSFNRDSGQIRWNREVFQQIPLRKEGKNSYATPTPVTDGQRVYAVFGDGSIAALTYDGSIVWTNRQVRFYSQHGLAASPILYKDLLIMPFDGSSTGEVKRIGWQIPWDQSFILGIDIRTGQVRWKGSRGLSRIAHVTPNLSRFGNRDLLISGAGDVIQAFDPNTGERIWSAYSQGEGVVPSVVLGEDLIYTASGFEKPTIRAIRPGGQGDVTSSHIAWEQKKGVPAIPSFIYLKPHLYTLTESGVAQCLDGKTGEVVWSERLDGRFSASPVLVEGRIYCLSEEGQTVVIEAKPEFKILARNSLNEKSQASMAVATKHFFIRSEKNLYGIGTPFHN